MIISFTGPQCVGKTTLLRECKNLYSDRFEFVDEVTRLVKRQFNVQINEAGSDITQCLIINKHIENSLMFNDNKGLILDRCILDGLCYTGYLHLEGKVSDWVMNYAKGVYFKLIDKIDYIIYPDPYDVELVDDGERSVDVEFRNKMIEIFETVITGSYGESIKNKIVRVKGSVEDRMKAINIILCQQT